MELGNSLSLDAMHTNLGPTENICSIHREDLSVLVLIKTKKIVYIRALNKGIVQSKSVFQLTRSTVCNL